MKAGVLPTRNERQEVLLAWEPHEALLCFTPAKGLHFFGSDCRSFQKVTPDLIQRIRNQIHIRSLNSNIRSQKSSKQYLKDAEGKLFSTENYIPFQVINTV